MEYGAPMNCPHCHTDLSPQARMCPQCGQPGPAMADVSPKSFVATILLCFFLGGFGIHRFYVGKIGTGILMLLTLGALGIWTIIDFIFILIGKFRDKDGKLIVYPG